MSSVLIPGERVRARELRRTRRVGAVRARAAARLAAAVRARRRRRARARRDRHGRRRPRVRGQAGDLPRARRRSRCACSSFIDVARFRRLRVAALPRHARARRGGPRARLLDARLARAGSSSRSSSSSRPSSASSRCCSRSRRSSPQRAAASARCAFVARARLRGAPGRRSSSSSPTSARRSCTSPSLARVLFVAGVRLRHFALLGGVAVLLAVARACGAAGRRRARAQAVPDRPPDVVPAPRPRPRGRGLQPVPGADRGRLGRARRARRRAPTQTNGDFLPEHQTDFVFAVLGEQRGLRRRGAAARPLPGAAVARAAGGRGLARRYYGSVVAAGISGWLLFSVFINVGMTIGIAPITGIPLPLSGFGGSGTITALLAVGVMQAIQLRAPAAASPATGTRRELSCRTMTIASGAVPTADGASMPCRCRGMPDVRGAHPAAHPTRGPRPPLPTCPRGAAPSRARRSAGLGEPHDLSSNAS